MRKYGIWHLCWPLVSLNIVLVLKMWENLESNLPVCFGQLFFLRGMNDETKKSRLTVSGMYWYRIPIFKRTYQYILRFPFFDVEQEYETYSLHFTDIHADMSYNIAIHMQISPIEFSHCQKCVCDIFFQLCRIGFHNVQKCKSKCNRLFWQILHLLFRSITDMYTVAVYIVDL